MAFFKKKSGYVSDFTQFIAGMKHSKPTLEAEQQAGRARLWDQGKIDLDQRNRELESAVKPSAYVYQSH